MSSSVSRWNQLGVAIVVLSVVGIVLEEIKSVELGVQHGVVIPSELAQGA